MIYSSWSIHRLKLLWINHLKPNISVLLHSLVLEDIDLLEKLVLVGAQVRPRGIIFIRIAVLRLDVVVLNDLLDLSGRVLEISLRAQTLRDDGDVVVVPGCIELVLDGPNVHFLLINHDHHLFNIKNGLKSEIDSKTYLPFIFVL